MIHIEPENMDRIQVALYAAHNVSVQDIKVTLKSEKLKNKNALILFDGLETSNIGDCIDQHHAENTNNNPSSRDLCCYRHPNNSLLTYPHYNNNTNFMYQPSVNMNDTAIISKSRHS